MRKFLHPLKTLAFTGIGLLILNQALLLVWISGKRSILVAAALMFPLLIPLRGLISDRLYTYRWIGFLTMLYFMLGVSEAFSNPQLRLYSILNMSGSLLLFFSAIYYSRYLKTQK